MKKRNIILESFEAISDDVWYERFDEYLDQGGEPVEILGSTYDLHFILRKCDPIKYNYEFERFKDMWEQEYGTETDDDSIEEESVTAEDEVEAPENAEDVITDDLNLDILLTSFDADVTLGVSDGVYYIKTGTNGYFEEIPVDTEEEAIAYYNNVVAEKTETINDPDEAAIADECNRIWESRQQKTKPVI